MLVMAVLGILATWGGLPSAPMLLGFILGPMVEQNFRKAVTYSDHGGYLEFFTRPVSCILLIFAVGSLVWPLIKKAINKKKAAA